MKNYYTIHLMPHKDGYTVTVPDIPGCITEGKSVKEAVDMARDAINMFLVDLEDDRQPIPQPSLPEKILAPDGAIAALVPVDTDSYRIASDNRAVRKNVSLPAWMANMVDKRGVNCSQVLQDALRNLLDVESMSAS